MDVEDLKTDDIRRGLIEYANNPVRDMVRSEEEESSLAAAVYRELVRYGYHVEKHFAVGAYTIDMVVLGQGQKVAIDCDGEHWVSSVQQAAEERCQQAVLERLGWNFLRIRGSHWYRDPEETFRRLMAELAFQGIEPEAAESDGPLVGQLRETVLAAVRQRAAEILNQWRAEAEEQEK